jgi:hypothetical protein
LGNAGEEEEGRRRIRNGKGKCEQGELKSDRIKEEH